MVLQFSVFKPKSEAVSFFSEGSSSPFAFARGVLGLMVRMQPFMGGIALAHIQNALIRG